MAEILSFDDSEKTNGSEKIKDQNLLKSLWEKFSNLETSIKLGIISITLLIIAIPLALQVDPNLIQNAFTPVPTIQPSIGPKPSGSLTAVPISKSPDKPQITINSLTPISGPVGTTITILGSGFSGTYKININLVQGVAEVKPINSNTLLFKFPGAICQIGKMCAAVLPPPGRYNISVTNSLGQTSNSLPFYLTQNVVPTATPTPTKAARTPAYFEIRMQGGTSAENFIIMLINSVDIQHARDLIAGRITTPPHVGGIITIVNNPVFYNPNWHFNLNPSTIYFFEISMEVCDANPLYIESHLGEVGGSFLPGNQWCPWNSYVLREINF